MLLPSLIVDLDFPGHILVPADGTNRSNQALDAASAPLSLLYRVPAWVLRLERRNGSGAITAKELEAALPTATRAAHVREQPGVSPRALVINALGSKTRFDEIRRRSVFLRRDAVEWIVSLGVKLLVSDVFESDATPQDVFQTLFACGIICVCNAVNLGVLPTTVTPTRPDASRVELSCVPLATPGAVQCPVRLLAEVEPRAGGVVAADGVGSVQPSSRL